MLLLIFLNGYSIAPCPTDSSVIFMTIVLSSDEEGMAIGQNRHPDHGGGHGRRHHRHVDGNEGGGGGSSSSTSAFSRMLRPWRHTKFGASPEEQDAASTSSRTSSSGVLDPDYNEGNTDYWSKTLWGDFCGSTTFHGWYFLGDESVGSGEGTLTPSDFHLL